MALAILLALVLGVLWLGVFGLGAFVTWRGVRGRVVDAYPRCVQCRHVLGPGGARPDRCPECGAVLHAVGAVSLGMRRARPPLIASGALIMLVSLTPSALLLGPSTPPAMPAIAVARAPAVRPMTVEQAAREREQRKRRVARNTAGEIMGPPAPAPDEPREAPDDTRTPVTDPEETLAAALAAALNPGWSYGAVASPSSYATPDAGYASIIDQELTFEVGDGTGMYLGEPSRLHGPSAMRFEPNESSRDSAFPSGGATPFTGSNLLSSARIDPHLLSTFVGARTRLGGIGPSPGGLAPGLGSPGIRSPGIRTPGIRTPGLGSPGIGSPAPGLQTPDVIRPKSIAPDR